jgi:hypothetical protein
MKHEANVHEQPLVSWKIKSRSNNCLLSNGPFFVKPSIFVCLQNFFKNMGIGILSIVHLAYTNIIVRFPYAISIKRNHPMEFNVLTNNCKIFFGQISN